MDNENSANSFCSFLGLSDDPDSAVAFPSEGNYCHRCKPIAAIRLTHQDEFCLTNKYTECPIFLQQAEGPLPENIRAHASGMRKRASQKDGVKKSLLILGVLAALLVIGWGLMQQRTKQFTIHASPTISRPATLIPSSTPVFSLLLDVSHATPTLVPTIVETPTLHLPVFGSSTPTPRWTATPSVTPILFVSKHKLNVPIGTDRQFIIRRVAGGENLDTYIQQYSTSFKAVDAINYYLHLRSRAPRDMLVIFPVGFTDITGMHILDVYQIKESEVGVNYDYIVRKFKVNLEDFKYYNGITAPSERPIVGDYYLIPLKPIP